MENGFQSRSIQAARGNTEQRFMRPARKLRVPDGWKERLDRIREWARARGKKRLFRDTVLIGGGLGVLYFLFLFFTLPDITDTRELIPDLSSVITDRKGIELYRLYGEENRTIIPGEDIPRHMKDAIVAIEDERFYDRGCLDMQAIARAFFRFGQAGGASTLTRQLARNALDLNRENIINRKLKELILGCQLESTYTKDELLNLYLNWIPFGQNAYGIELASRIYFNQPTKELTLAQSSILASLPQRPSYLSPYGRHVHTEVSEEVIQKIVDGEITSAADIPDEDVTIGLLGANVGTGSTTVYIGGRTDQVLRNMQNLGYITEAQRLGALKDLETIEFKPARENIRAAHFVLWVKSQAEEIVADGAEAGFLSQGGLTIETTLDWEMQQAAEELIAKKREDIASIYGAHNIAMVAVERGTNRILTYIGNADYSDEEFDGKVDMARAARQPGSSFKPIVYAAAFEKGFGPATPIYDVPTRFGTDSPQNFDGGFWGLLSIRRALGASRNIPAIKAFFMAGGEENVLEVAGRLGAVSPTEQRRRLREDNPDFAYGWPLALGAAETPLLEMVQAYATLADGGSMKPLVSIQRIKDRRGNILYEADTQSDGVQAIDPRIAYQVTSILSDASARPGEYWQSVLSVPGFATAAKTGTSNKCLERDANGGCKDRKPDNMWTMGYTPNIVAGIWAGNADAAALSAKAESLTIVSPIWKDYMIRAHKLLENPKASFDVPSGIVQSQISTLSGQLPTECTPVNSRKADVFLQENAPSEADPACARLVVDRVTGLLASDECPAEAREERSFLVPKEALSDRFPHWQQAVVAWAQGRMGAYDPLNNTFTGSAVPLPLAPTTECTLALTPGRLEQPTLDIDYPNDGGSATYPSFQPRLSYQVGSKIREIRAEIDGKAAGTSTENHGSFVINVPRSIKKDGTHSLEITLVDEYYNAVTREVDFRFEEDNNPPNVEFVTPQGSMRTRTGQIIMLEAEAEDDEGGIKYVQFYLNERLLSTKPNEPYRLEWPQDLTPGTYEIRAVATDLAGNEAEDGVELTIE